MLFVGMLLLTVAAYWFHQVMWWASDHLTKAQTALIIAVVFATVMTIAFRDVFRKRK